MPREENAENIRRVIQTVAYSKINMSEIATLIERLKLHPHLTTPEVLATETLELVTANTNMLIDALTELTNQYAAKCDQLEAAEEKLSKK